MNEHVIMFLEGLTHGPCAGVPLAEYEKWVRAGALRLLAEISVQETEHAFERDERPELDRAASAYAAKLLQAHLRMARLAMQLNRIDGADGKKPLPDGLNFAHVGDLARFVELLDAAGDVLDEHVNGIAEMREGAE